MRRRNESRRHVKDGYGLAGRSARPMSARRRWDEPVDGLVVQRLELDLKESLSEIQQLRTALRASSCALHNAAALLPQPQREGLEEQTEELEQLMRQLHEKDVQIRDLHRNTASAEQVSAHHRRAMFSVLNRWSPMVDFPLLREPWEAWKELWREKREVLKVKNAVEKTLAEIQPKLKKIFSGLSKEATCNELRTVMHAWAAVVKASKKEAQAKKAQAERVQATVLFWSNDIAAHLKLVCLSSWKQLTASVREEHKLEGQRREHMRIAKEMKNQALARAAMALGAPQDDPNELRLILRSWQAMMLDSRVLRIQEEERKQAKANAERLATLAQNRASALIAGGEGPLMALYFRAWHTGMMNRREKTAAERRDVFSTIFVAWRALTVAGREVKRLERDKKELQDREAKYKEQAERRTQMRGAFFSLLNGRASGENDIFMQLVFSQWREAVNQTKQELAKEKWKDDFEAHQKARLAEQRARAVFRNMELSNHALLLLVLTAWYSQVKESDRDKWLTSSQRVYEEERRRRAKDDKELQLEVKQAEARFHQMHQKREAFFAMALEERDNALLLKVVWSAWVENIMLTKKLELERIQEIQAGVGHGRLVQNAIGAAQGPVKTSHEPPSRPLPLLIDTGERRCPWCPCSRWLFGCFSKNRRRKKVASPSRVLGVSGQKAERVSQPSPSSRPSLKAASRGPPNMTHPQAKKAPAAGRGSARIQPKSP